MSIKFCGIEPLSLVDLDGKLACTIFTNGCNFRCPFCHNKDLVLNQNIQEISFDEIINFLKLRKNMLDAVCVTGGEPTLHPDLEEKLIEIKKLGYYIKLDTNGSNPDMVIDLYNKGLIDYVAMDIKNTLPKYSKTCDNVHVNLFNIQKTINFLMTSGIEYEFRTTLINEFHTIEDIIEIGKWLNGAKKYFLQKFVNNNTCLQSNLNEISYINAINFKKAVKDNFEKVELRGY
ncbi:MAG: anaerobic ribonucleoside-triphosphate reductase activating protein [Bacilli bacterium]|nr:anaerobic ribonucleoside-triphosphate reductase activating protein [Bacilli bacterium]